MYRLTVYVPDSHVEPLKTALFAAGAGRLGDYDLCSWQVMGTGQFRPLAGADPFVGRPGTLERLPEWRLEMVLTDDVLGAVVAALREAHPYEEPAFGVVKLVDC